MSKKKIPQFNWGELVSGDLSGFQKEMHQEGVKQFKAMGRNPQGNVVLPFQVLTQRDLTVGTDDQGGYTVATDLYANSFIDMLHNAMKVNQMGATTLVDLVGDIAIPKQATGATASWEGENDAGSEQSQTFGQVAMAPNRVGCYSEISKQLNVQSSISISNLVKNDLATAIALAIDYAALHGAGSGNEPEGLINTSNVGSVVGGTNGLAPTFAHIIELETDVATANGFVNTSTTGYLTNSKVRGKLKQTQKAANSEDFVWEGQEMNGYRAEVSNQVSSTLDKGSSSAICSACFFGDWSQLMIGFWGGLDIVVDPFTLATTNMTRITVNAYADVACRNPESFSIFKDILTT